MKRFTLSSGVVIVHGSGADCRYLLLRVFTYWDFPKGLVEAGETALEAARREVREETSIEQLDFRWGEVFTETPSYGAGKVARYYLAETHSTEVMLPVSPELGRPEHDEYRWLGYADARRLLVPRVQTVLDWARELSSC